MLKREVASDICPVFTPEFPQRKTGKYQLMTPPTKINQRVKQKQLKNNYEK